jgi:hypothetical protein
MIVTVASFHVEKQDMLVKTIQAMAQPIHMGLAMPLRDLRSKSSRFLAIGAVTISGKLR